MRGFLELGMGGGGRGRGGKGRLPDLEQATPYVLYSVEAPIKWMWKFHGGPFRVGTHVPKVLR